MGLLALLAAGAMFAQPSMSDKKFAREAAQGGMAEVELGQLAVSNADSQKVKHFGQKMVDDHGKANDKLKQCASKENMTLPSTVSAKDKALKMKLSSLHGAAFDKAYMAAMVKDHEKDVADFQKEADSGSDSNLKDFASSTLPTLKEHLQMAKDCASAVGASTN